jgi:hypothetical protein
MPKKWEALRRKIESTAKESETMQIAKFIDMANRHTFMVQEPFVINCQSGLLHKVSQGHILQVCKMHTWTPDVAVIHQGHHSGVHMTWVLGPVITEGEPGQTTGGQPARTAVGSATPGYGEQPEIRKRNTQSPGNKKRRKRKGGQGGEKPAKAPRSGTQVAKPRAQDQSVQPPLQEPDVAEIPAVRNRDTLLWIQNGGSLTTLTYHWY